MFGRLKGYTKKELRILLVTLVVIVTTALTAFTANWYGPGDNSWITYASNQYRVVQNNTNYGFGMFVTVTDGVGGSNTYRIQAAFASAPGSDRWETVKTYSKLMNISISHHSGSGACGITTGTYQVYTEDVLNFEGHAGNTDGYMAMSLPITFIVPTGYDYTGTCDITKSEYNGSIMGMGQSPAVNNTHSINYHPGEPAAGTLVNNSTIYLFVGLNALGLVSSGKLADGNRYWMYGNWAMTYNFSFTPHTYSISYNGNGGTLPSNPATYNVVTNSFTLRNPSRTGYTFTGWTGSNGSTPQTSVTIGKGSTGDRSYTANWRANSYNVYFNAQGGTLKHSSPLSVTYDSTNYNSLTPPAKTGYVCEGWYTASSGGTKVYNGNGTYVAGCGYWSSAGKWCATSGVTLYAHWRAAKMTISYNAGVGEVTSLLYKKDSNNKITNIAGTVITDTITSETTYYDLYNIETFGIERAGYHTDPDDAWNTKVDGTGVKLNQDDSAEGTTNKVTTTRINGSQISADTNVQLYPNWKANVFTARFNANGGSGSVPSDLTVIYNTTQNIPENSLIAPTGDEGGWQMAGWADSEQHAAEGVVAVSETGDISKYAGEHGGTITFYAVWRRQVTFASGISKDTTKTVYQFYGKNGSDYSSGEVTVPEGTKEISGWTFVGWRADKQAAEKQYNATGTYRPIVAAAEDYTLYGIYTRTLTLSYDKNTEDPVTGTAAAEQTFTQTYSSSGNITAGEFTLRNNGWARRGYTFIKWDVGNEGTLYNTWIPSVTASPEKTALAIWDPNKYTLTMDPNGGSYRDSEDPTDITVIYDSNQNYDVGIPTMQGMVFNGWYTKKKGGKALYDPDGICLECAEWTASGETAKWKGITNMTLYAHWEKPAGFRVMFSVGKSSNTAPGSKDTVQGGADYGRIANVKGEGYQYEVWQGFTPDGTDDAERSLKAGYTYHTRSLAFQLDKDVTGYNFIGLSGGADYNSELDPEEHDD